MVEWLFQFHSSVLTEVLPFNFSSKSAGNDVIGIDLGTTNSCVSVMEGKVSFMKFIILCYHFLSSLFVFIYSLIHYL